MHESTDHDVLDHGEPAERLNDLERAPHPEAGIFVGGRRRHGPAIGTRHRDIARCGFEEARHQVEYGGLAGTVRAYDAEDLAALDRDRDVVGGGEPAEL